MTSTFNYLSKKVKNMHKSSETDSKKQSKLQITALVSFRQDRVGSLTPAA